MKRVLWDLLDVDEVGIRLTESCAMWPGASVSGWYIGHPDSRYFAVGPIGQDQLEDYAARRCVSVDEATRWLGPNLEE